MNPHRPQPSAVLAPWMFACEQDGQQLVWPDGCQDVVVHWREGARPTRPDWRCAHLADAPQWFAFAVGDCARGWRFRPGSRMDEARLMQALTKAHPDDEARIAQAIAEHVHHDPRTDEALHALSSGATVEAAARSLGVGVRTLERWMQAHTGRAPRYWQGLARVRRAALGLMTDVPLAELAVVAGYSDQAHFTRECRRWLAATPAALRERPAWLALLAEPGLGTSDAVCV